MEFQIRLIDKNGCGEFLYFESDVANKEVSACATANDHLKKKRERDDALRNSFFHTPYKPFRSLRVVEYDNVNHIAKRGGFKFKLSLSFFTAKFQDGSRITNQWYESD